MAEFADAEAEVPDIAEEAKAAAAAEPDAPEALATETTPAMKAVPVVLRPVHVVYCGACSLPLEYCEFTDVFETACRLWREENGIEDDEQAQADRGEAEAEAKDAADEAADGDEAGGGGGEEKRKKKKKKKVSSKKSAAAAALPEEEQRVVITRVQRKARKFVTTIAGVDTIPGLRLKDVSKQLGRRYATGASVSTNAMGKKEIVVQGDVIFGNVKDTVKDLLMQLYEVTSRRRQPRLRRRYLLRRVL
eukprot:scaffold2373_cov239-Pinguiococcus_pyrenoidosus.AAC.3